MIAAVMITKNSKNERSKRNNVVAISALLAWGCMNDNAFAEDGDSGSIYYASRGSFRYPFAIHNGVGYEKMQIPTTGLFYVPKNKIAFVTRKVYYGTPLR